MGDGAIAVFAGVGEVTGGLYTRVGRGYGLIEGESRGEGKKYGLLVDEGDDVGTRRLELFTGALLGTVPALFEMPIFALLKLLLLVGGGGVGLSKGSNVLKNT